MVDEKQTNFLDLQPTVIRVGNEEAFHAPVDYLRSSGRKKDLVIAVLFALLSACVVAGVVVYLRPKEAFIVLMKDGVSYVISGPTRSITPRDALVLSFIKQDLQEFGEAYFTRSLLTAEHDIKKAKWFMIDPVADQFQMEATSMNGWVNELRMNKIPETHIRVRNILLRDGDIEKPPYHATILYTKVYQNTPAENFRTDVTFVIAPELAAKGPLPLFNAMGLLILQRPIEEKEY